MGAEQPSQHVTSLLHGAACPVMPPIPLQGRTHLETFFPAPGISLDGAGGEWPAQGSDPPIPEACWGRRTGRHLQALAG